jgi:hypothetical protein
MNWVTWFLFESVAALGAVLGIVLFVLLVHWRRSGRPWPLLIGLGVAAVLLVVQALVVTQREWAARMLDPIEKDLVASRTAALAATLAPDFETGGLDGDRFVAFVRRELQSTKMRWLDRWGLQLQESAADRFVVTTNYSADVTTGGYSGSIPSTWSITFVRTAAGWKIACIRPLHIAGVDTPTWEDLDPRAL